jgi:hypothetical protein
VLPPLPPVPAAAPPLPCPAGAPAEPHAGKTNIDASHRPGVHATNHRRARDRVRGGIRYCTPAPARSATASTFRATSSRRAPSRTCAFLDASIDCRCLDVAGARAQSVAREHVVDMYKGMVPMGRLARADCCLLEICDACSVRRFLQT